MKWKQGDVHDTRSTQLLAKSFVLVLLCRANEGGMLGCTPPFMLAGVRLYLV